jgi:hypothetical protein
MERVRDERERWDRERRRRGRGGRKSLQGLPLPSDLQKQEDGLISDDTEGMIWDGGYF